MHYPPRSNVIDRQASHEGNRIRDDTINGDFRAMALSRRAGKNDERKNPSEPSRISPDPLGYMELPGE
jgi:hypothetical protein